LLEEDEVFGDEAKEEGDGWDEEIGCGYGLIVREI
jgi:hypothetical protein